LIITDKALAECASAARASCYIRKVMKPLFLAGAVKPLNGANKNH